MNFLNEFGVILKPGRSVKTLSEGAQFFKERLDIDIIGYRFSIETPKRRRTDLIANEVLPFTRCTICDKKLYRYVAQDEILNLKDYDYNQTYIEHKRHLVFYDKEGQSYKTCYRLGVCFKRQGFEPGTNYVLTSIKPLSAEQFSNISPKTEQEKIFFAGFEQNYNHHVVPFVLKWGNSHITKSNILDFLNELEELKLRHLPFYQGDKERKIAINKILNMIGIING